MPVNGLDHINIVTADIEGTRRFYSDLLGLGEGVPPPMPPGVEVNWLTDSTGRPILHLQRHDPARHGPDDGAGSTGKIDHVALECADFHGIAARCEELGVPYRTNIIGDGIFYQIFVTDPNGVMLELNFRG